MRVCMYVRVRVCVRWDVAREGRKKDSAWNVGSVIFVSIPISFSRGLNLVR